MERIYHHVRSGFLRHDGSEDVRRTSFMQPLDAAGGMVCPERAEKSSSYPSSKEQYGDSVASGDHRSFRDQVLGLGLESPSGAGDGNKLQVSKLRPTAADFVLESALAPAVAPVPIVPSPRGGQSRTYHHRPLGTSTSTVPLRFPVHPPPPAKTEVEAEAKPHRLEKSESQTHPERHGKEDATAEREQTRSRRSNGEKQKHRVIGFYYEHGSDRVNLLMPGARWGQPVSGDPDDKNGDDGEGEDNAKLKRFLAEVRSSRWVLDHKSNSSSSSVDVADRNRGSGGKQGVMTNQPQRRLLCRPHVGPEIVVTGPDSPSPADEYHRNSGRTKYSREKTRQLQRKPLPPRHRAVAFADNDDIIIDRYNDDGRYWKGAAVNDPGSSSSSSYRPSSNSNDGGDGGWASRLDHERRRLAEVSRFAHDAASLSPSHPHYPPAALAPLESALSLALAELRRVERLRPLAEAWGRDLNNQNQRPGQQRGQGGDGRHHRPASMMDRALGALVARRREAEGVADAMAGRE